MIFVCKEMMNMNNDNFKIKNDILTKYIGKEKNVVIPGNIRRIGKEAFYESFVEMVIIEEGVKIIGTSAFCGCGHLTEIVLPNTLEVIEYDAFCACSNLERIVLPDSLVKIGKAPFTICDRLKEIVVGENNSAVKSSDGNLFSKDGKKLIWYQVCSEEPEYVVPDGTEIIGEAAFAYNNYIERIVLPDGVKKICGDAFGRCKNLKEVIIPESVNEIEDELDGLGTFSHVHPVLRMLGITPPTIRTPKGSYAEEYASAHEIPFVAI